ncbi:MAG: glycoside hydrolase family 99-like domain-containing protein [Proteobacteria bacterium]|nr:glycoside hydrolase family 99-like domain-containing protein [Pseudomonadota bacterium]
MSPPPAVKLIAFYLPQFHPIPENDLWWGKGFTEWTNVTKASPLFPGHYQPHLPTELGFYDLRVRESRRDQIRLAKEYGIDGFCYHYYWFGGKRLLEKPLDDMLADPESDMPFCLCWANENWTRRWDGAEQEILIKQTYGPDMDRDFIADLIKYLKDPRYIHFDGGPLIIVYAPQHLPDCRETLNRWRQYCADNGIPKIHVACALTHRNWDHEQFGFDSAVEFPPHNMRCHNLAHEMFFFEPFSGYCPDYTELAEMYLARSYGAASSGFRGVLPSWDNTARRNSAATVILNGTPENYEYWLSRAVRKTVEEFPGQERFVFINAWNEWAEGCHLEPDRKYGRRFLEATLRAKEGSALRSWTHRGPPSRPAPQMEMCAKPQKSWLRRTWRKVKRTIRPKRHA